MGRNKFAMINLIFEMNVFSVVDRGLLTFHCHYSRIFGGVVRFGLGITIHESRWVGIGRDRIPAPQINIP
jgi:hypothetical protein